MRQRTADNSERPNKRVKRSYDFRGVHKDLENGLFAGSYGWDNAAYMAIAEEKAGVDMKQFHSKNRETEYILPKLRKLIEEPRTQKNWDRICTFDPFGLTASTPTIAATTSKLNIPELKDLKRDGVIVDEHGSVNTVKISIYYAWNLPELSKKLNMNEQALRTTLFKFSNDKRLLDPKINVYMPPVGGLTIYTFGNIDKLSDPATHVAVRVHDACNGSDVFGTDICTCRPYLMFAMKHAVECAQDGGVGICIYFRKEGRSLGEITKFRVYNARKHQEGGDRPEKYFFHTENIAGIRDARFQDMMPDALVWLGIRRIDFLYSMSNEKYDALVKAGISIHQRVPLPDQFVPRSAFVELHAKIASGYHTEDVKNEECIEEMKQLKTIRTQCSRVFELAQQNKLNHFSYHPENLHVAVAAVVECIETHYPKLDIPSHSRFRHFEPQQLKRLETMWNAARIPKLEQIRRFIDLATVSVLLDAGAGKDWQYVSCEGNVYGRSEGLAVASLEMFEAGLFSSDPAVKTRVNSLGLKNLKLQDLKTGFQLTTVNTMVGLEGRTSLLNRLGDAMEANPSFFGAEVKRPGNVVDYLIAHSDEKGCVDLTVLWNCIINGFESIWPHNLSGVNRGDVWCYQPLKKTGVMGSDLVPFHKLSQWLCYSWLEALGELDELEIVNVDIMTGLAEYRNGGLLIDSGLLKMIDPENLERAWDVGSELIVEWRAMTIACLDIIAEQVRSKFNKTAEELPLACVLEGGTWRAGRLLAEKFRGPSKPPPIKIRSDGTVF